jgi:C-terminal processing protease CtpA/Prc
MIGEHTVGSAAKQKLVKLPDGSAMLLSYMRYAAPNGNAIHEKGCSPKCQSTNQTSSSARSTDDRSDPAESARVLLAQKKSR